MTIESATEEESITWGFEHARMQHILREGTERRELFNAQRLQKVKRENEAEEPL